MKNKLIITTLFVLTLTTYLFSRTLKEDIVMNNNYQEKNISIVTTDTKMYYFNENNRLKYMLTSPKVMDYTDNSGTELLLPHIDFFNEQADKIWAGKGDIGFISNDKNNLLLEKNVRIIEEPLGNKPMYIFGEIMNYDVKKGLVTSDLPVKIDDGVIVQKSNTFKLNTNTKKLNAIGKVQATYQN